MALLCLLALAGCSANYPATPLSRPVVTGPTFVMPDGARLPYRAWMPPRPPSIVVLALHGFNDSADAWEYPAPSLVATGIGVIAPDQRGFGAAPGRGRWPGATLLESDAASMALIVHAQFPSARLYLMGESMGAAVLMRLAGDATAFAGASPVAGYVLVSPAVWGWRQLSPPLRASLWVANALAPGLSLTAGPIRVRASDNRVALLRLSQDPRTLTRTRVAAVAGLVALMTDAQQAASRIHAPALVLYGGHDELVPKRAMAAAWRALAARAPDVRLAYYPPDYHLMLRDLHRDAPISDIVAWLQTPGAPLPSGADITAATRLAEALLHSAKSR